MRAIGTRIFDALSSIGLCIVLLIFLGLLTWLGTLEQVHSGLYDVQKKYFESFILIHRAGPLAIPLPGANLVLCLLFVNIVLGGIIRLRKGSATAGILVAHLGIAFLLFSGFVKLYHSEDGHVTLFEDQSSDTFQSYYRWEIAITEEQPDGKYKEYLIPQEDFLDARGARRITLSAADIPFDLEVSGFVENCQPLPKGPMFEVDVPVVDGVYLHEMEKMKEAEGNVAGAYVRALSPSGLAPQEGVLWGLDRQPLTVTQGDKRWAVELRHEQYPMPFSIQLDKFTKEDHPRMAMAKSFESDVTVGEAGTSREVKISMNEPLRDGGLVLYQASWGPSNARPGDPLFSTLAVVRNPADQWPEWSCWIIAIGLLMHFVRKLNRYVRVERKAL